MERVLVNIPSNPIFERIVRASADELGQAIGLPPERVEDLKLAVSEAVNNAIDHGNQRESAKLVEVIFALDADKLEVRIRDEGPGTDFSTHGHYINMSSTKYSAVACGFYQTPGGKFWAVQDFK